MDKRLWTVKDVANYLAPTEETVRRYARSGRLACAGSGA